MNTVEPIRDPKKILAIKKNLREEPDKRNYLLFCMGINLALRAGDLLKIKVSDILNGKGNIPLIPLERPGAIRPGYITAQVLR